MGDVAFIMSTPLKKRENNLQGNNKVFFRLIYFFCKKRDGKAGIVLDVFDRTMLMLCDRCYRTWNPVSFFLKQRTTTILLSSTSFNDEQLRSTSLKSMTGVITKATYETLEEIW